MTATYPFRFMALVLPLLTVERWTETSKLNFLLFFSSYLSKMKVLSTVYLVFTHLCEGYQQIENVVLAENIGNLI